MTSPGGTTRQGAKARREGLAPVPPMRSGPIRVVIVDNYRIVSESLDVIARELDLVS